MESDSQTFTLQLQRPAQVIEGLKAEIINRVEKHKIIGSQAAVIIIQTLENFVRTGWALREVQKELKGVKGAFESFVERNLPISQGQAEKYCSVSRMFQRDQENFDSINDIRREYGLDPLLVEAIHPLHLTQQILEINANSFSDLQRAAGISKPKALNNSMIRMEQKPAFLRLGKTLSMCWVRFNRINKEAPISDWAPEEKRAVREDLKPLVDLYESLRA